MDPFRSWPEGRREESVGSELWLRTLVPPRLLPHAPDSRTRFLDEGNAIEEVGNERIAAHTAGAKLRLGQSFRQTSGVADLDPVVVDLDEDVRARLEVVPVHNGISDRFAQGAHGIFGYILTPQFLNAVSGSGVTLDETETVLDIVDHATNKVRSRSRG
jgi:hypothetical protein